MIDLRRWVNLLNRNSVSRAISSAEISNYWQSRLTDLPPLLDLPANSIATNTNRLEGVPDRKSSEPIAVPPLLLTTLQQLAAREKTSLHVVFLGVYFTLLYRYTGQGDLLVITIGQSDSLIDKEFPIASSAELIPVRINITGNLSFQELLARLKLAISEASSFLPLTWQDFLRATSGQVKDSLFQLQFAIENSGMTGVQFDDSILKTGLQLELHRHQDQLCIQFDYPPARFEQQMVNALLNHYQYLLSAVANDPAKPISRLALLSSQEQQCLLTTWNATQVAFPAANSIHELFETRAAVTPDCIAITCREQHYTYQTLNQRANQLANYLRTLGVGPDVLVGVYMERSFDAVLCIMAVLKAGGAYLPLDASYPEDRLAYIMGDAEAKILLTHAELAAHLQSSSATIVCVDTDWDRISQQSKDNPQHHTQPEHLAFVLYTSGSTGDPKGVEVTHSNLINYYFAWEHTHQLQETINGVCQIAYFSFAVFQGDVIRALCAGKKLLICPNETLMSPRLLYELMRNEKADFVEFVPVLLRGLLAYCEETAQNLAFMKVIIVGADRWYLREHRKVRQLCGLDTRFVHVYGLSETTLDSAYFTRTDLVLDENQLTPIGRPFPNVQTYILDQHRQPVPVGVAGSLYIGGAGVAKGYHRRPDLTDKSFVKNPFSDIHGDRLYNTGDLARFLPDGNIAFLGRRDQQVKIRGFRVELGEVEAGLESHPSIRTAIVQPWQASSGVTQLAAYYVCKNETDGHAPCKNDIQGFLRQRLPEFMVPAFLIQLDQLPLTPSGKVNRRALPDPTASSALVEQSKPDEHSDIQQLVMDICKHAIGINNLAPDDNFQNKGGDSMAIMTMITGLENNFGIILDEDDINLNNFSTVNVLTAFVKDKIAASHL